MSRVLKGGGKEGEGGEGTFVDVRGMNFVSILLRDMSDESGRMTRTVCRTMLV